MNKPDREEDLYIEVVDEHLADREEDIDLAIEEAVAEATARYVRIGEQI